MVDFGCEPHAGLIDFQLFAPTWPHFQFNNTYGFETITEQDYKDAMEALTAPGGCHDSVSECRRIGELYDPEELGSNETVNALCADALNKCHNITEGAYIAKSGRSVFDIGHALPDLFPPPYAQGFFNQKWVQDDLGVSANFTQLALAGTPTFFATGDVVRRNISTLNYVAQKNVKIVLIYGDRDSRCNCKMIHPRIHVRLRG